MAFKSTGDLSWVDRFLRVNVMVAALVAGAHGISLATATSRCVVALLTLSTAAALFIFATGVWVMMRSGEAAKLRVLTLHARIFAVFAVALACAAAAVTLIGPPRGVGRFKWAPGAMTAFFVYAAVLVRRTHSEGALNRFDSTMVVAFIGALLDVGVAMRMLAR